MSKIDAINFGTYTNSYNNVQTLSESVKTSHQENNNIIDCTDLYNQQEIKNILKEIGAKVPNMQSPLYVPRYTVQYYKNSDTLVINNVTMTNDTTEILSDGSVHNVGSWHNKELAPAGSFDRILDDAKKRIEGITH